jgi:hypothetical protein
MRSWNIAEPEPRDSKSNQQDKNVLPFFADDSCRARIVGDKPCGDSFKTCHELCGMKRSDGDSHGDSNYQRCDQQPLHQLSSFLRD